MNPLERRGDRFSSTPAAVTVPEYTAIKSTMTKGNERGWIDPHCIKGETLPIPEITIRALRDFFTIRRPLELTLDATTKGLIIAFFQRIEQTEKAEGREDLFNEFIHQSIFLNRERIVLKGDICLAQLFFNYLEEAKLDFLRVTGGQTRRLLSEFAEKTVQKRYDSTFSISPWLKQHLEGKRPDWDIVLIDKINDFNQFLKANNAVYDQLIKAFFKNVKAEHIAYYRLLISRFFCKTVEKNPGNEWYTNISFLDAHNEKIDMSLSSVHKANQFFEICGFDILIDKTQLKQWLDNPCTTLAKGIQVSYDRVAHEGVQACYDLVKGYLHARNPDQQDHKGFPRMVDWLGHGYQILDGETEKIYLEKCMEFKKGAQGAQWIFKLLRECDQDHNMGDTHTFTAMVVNAYFSLKRIIPENKALLDAFHAYCREHVLLKKPEQIDTFTSYLVLLSFLAGETSICENDLVVQIFHPKALFLKIPLKTVTTQLLSFNFEEVEEIDTFFTTRLDRCERPQWQYTCEQWLEIDLLGKQLLASPSTKAQSFGMDVLLVSAANNPNFTYVYDLVTALAPHISHLAEDPKWTARFSQAACKQGVAVNNRSTEEIWIAWLAKLSKSDLSLVKAVIEKNCLDPSSVETLIETLISTNPSAALNLYNDCIKKSVLAPTVECSLFEKLLFCCRQPEHVPSLQKGAVHCLYKVLHALPAQRRKGHGRKAVHSTSEHPTLTNKESFKWLVLQVFSQQPDEAALFLLVQCTKAKLITEDVVWHSCFACTVSHPCGGVANALKLWNEGLQLKISFKKWSGSTLLLSLCQQIDASKEVETVSRFYEFFPLLVDNLESADHKEKAAQLLMNALDALLIEKSFIAIENLLRQYGPLLSSKMAVYYYSHLLSIALEEIHLESAFGLLCELHTLTHKIHPAFETFLLLLDDKCNQAALDNDLVPLILKVVLYCPSIFHYFEHDHVFLYSHLLEKILSHYSKIQGDLRGKLREDWRTIFPGIIELYQQNGFDEAIIALFAHVLEKQFKLTLDERLYVWLYQSCHSCLKTHAETISLLLNHPRIKEGVKSPANASKQVGLYKKLAIQLISKEATDPKNEQKAYDCLLKMFALIKTFELPWNDEQTIVFFVSYFHNKGTFDPEILLQQALKCPSLNESPVIATCYLKLANESGNTLRSLNILINERSRFSSCDAAQITQTVTRAIEECKTVQEELLLSLELICYYNLSDKNLLSNWYRKVDSCRSEQLNNLIWTFFDRLHTQGFFQHSASTEPILLSIIFQLITPATYKRIIPYLLEFEKVLEKSKNAPSVNTHGLAYNLLLGGLHLLRTETRPEECLRYISRILALRTQFSTLQPHLYYIQMNTQVLLAEIDRNLLSILLRKKMSELQPSLISLLESIIKEREHENIETLFNLFQDLVTDGQESGYVDFIAKVSSESIRLFCFNNKIIALSAALLNYNNFILNIKAFELIELFVNYQSREMPVAAESAIIRNVLKAILKENTMTNAQVVQNFIKNKKSEQFLLAEDVAILISYLICKQYERADITFSPIPQIETCYLEVKRHLDFFLKFPGTLNSCMPHVIRGFILIMKYHALVDDSARSSTEALNQFHCNFIGFLSSFIQVEGAIAIGSDEDFYHPLNLASIKTGLDPITNYPLKDVPIRKDALVELKEILEAYSLKDLSKLNDLKQNHCCFKLRFNSEQDKDLFFELVSHLLVEMTDMKMLRDNFALARLISNYRQLYLRILIDNYPERGPLLIESFLQVIFTYHQEYYHLDREMNKHLLNSIILNEGFFKAYPQQIFETIVYLHPHNVDYPFIKEDQKIFSYLGLAERLITDLPIVLTRAAEILTQTPQSYLYPTAHLYRDAFLKIIKKLHTLGTEPLYFLPQIGTTVFLYEKISESILQMQLVNDSFQLPEKWKMAGEIAENYIITLFLLSKRKGMRADHIYDFLVRGCRVGLFNERFDVVIASIKLIVAHILEEFKTKLIDESHFRFYSLKEFFALKLPYNPDHHKAIAQIFVTWIQKLAESNQPKVVRFAKMEFFTSCENVNIKTYPKLLELLAKSLGKNDNNKDDA